MNNNNLQYFTNINYFLQNGLEEWHKIFLIGAFVYIVPSIWFAIFGSGEVQEWNEIKAVEEENNPSENKEQSKAVYVAEMSENVPCESHVENKS